MPKGTLTKEWHTGRRLLKPGAVVNVTKDKYNELELGGYFAEPKPERKALPFTRFMKTEAGDAPEVKHEGDE
jgi:hypothetical protein